MILPIIAFTILGLFGFGAAINSSLPCKEIVDIYYPPSRVGLAYDTNCPFTLTQTCEECQTTYLRRDQYEEWADGYRRLGLQPPYPKRIDKNKVYRAAKHGRDLELL